MYILITLYLLFIKCLLNCTQQIISTLKKCLLYNFLNFISLFKFILVPKPNEYIFYRFRNAFKFLFYELAFNKAYDFL